MNKIQVLDKGYVRFVDSMGNDLRIVNAARVSFEKESFEFDNKDARLLAFLAREDHSSPLRQAAVTFEVYAPLMVARQWYKYAVASAHMEDQNGWNESSRRYVTEEPVFYIPDATEWRVMPENKKQGSGLPIDSRLGAIATQQLLDYVDEGVKAYEYWMKIGICAEQARLFLPAYGMYVRWYWTASLGAVIHMLNQRMAHDAQKEIQDYALAVYEHLNVGFPETCKVFLEKPGG